MKVLMVSSEVEPFFKTGGLGDVLAALPKALKKANVDVRVMMPLYKCIKDKYQDKLHHLGHIFVDLNWRHQYCGVFEYVENDITYYFLDNEFYLTRAYDDLDLERFCFLSTSAFEVLPFIKFKPNILHIHDWHTGVMAALFDYKYQYQPFYQKMKIVYTIHNLQYQGKFEIGHVRDMLPLSDKYYYGNPDIVNLMELGIRYSHMITTVSPSYKDEIQTPRFGEGLDWLLKQRNDSLVGILNGVDYDIYSPEVDNLIAYKYNFDSYQVIKKKNKKELLKSLNLPTNTDVPLIGVVSRLATQKGMNLVLSIMDKLFEGNVNMVLLGSGDSSLENSFLYFQNKYPNKFRAVLKFDNTLAHKIYASSDLFLMPSEFEPCGLAQIICLKYGTIPIVHEVGGLKDTIQAYDEFSHKGNGFSFAGYNANNFMYTIQRALQMYYNKNEFQTLISNAMHCDYSWNSSALKYKKLYNQLIKIKKE